MDLYPIYRIPDAPLAAKFLTYHSLAPVACSATHYGALCPTPARLAPSWQPSGPLCLPAIGLKCCSRGCGSWLDAVPGLHGELHIPVCYSFSEAILEANSTFNSLRVFQISMLKEKRCPRCPEALHKYEKGSLSNL